MLYNINYYSDNERIIFRVSWASLHLITYFIFCFFILIIYFYFKSYFFKLYKHNITQLTKITQVEIAIILSYYVIYLFIKITIKINRFLTFTINIDYFNDVNRYIYLLRLVLASAVYILKKLLRLVLEISIIQQPISNSWKFISIFI